MRKEITNTPVKFLTTAVEEAQEKGGFKNAYIETTLEKAWLYWEDR